MVKKIRDFVDSKNFVCVSAETSVFEAVKKASELFVGGVLVKKDNDLVGIFTENDLGRRVISKGLDPKTTIIESVMTPNPVTVDSNTDVDTCMFMMMRNNFRHIPLRDSSGKIYAVASVRDVLKAKIKEINELSEASNVFEATNHVDSKGEDTISQITDQYKA